MKDARAEAQKEIDDYRKQKEEEFKKFESDVSPGPSPRPASPPPSGPQIAPRRQLMQDLALERQQESRR